MDAHAPPPDQVTATVEFVASGSTIRARIPVPAGPARPSDLLPAARAVSESIIDASRARAEAAGVKISCRAGCGACCRQLVPISEPEARAIHALVESLSAGRRAEIKARFARARERLDGTRFLTLLSNPETFPYGETRTFAADYFRLGIPCPFLESESCSIYPDRPITCREYLVSSDPAHCAAPTEDTIRLIPLAARVSAALARLGQSPGTGARWVPLVLALDWVEAHPEETADQNGPEMLEELFARMAERRNGPSDPVTQTGPEHDLRSPTEQKGDNHDT